MVWKYGDVVRMINIAKKWKKEKREEKSIKSW